MFLQMSKVQTKLLGRVNQLSTSHETYFTKIEFLIMDKDGALTTMRKNYDIEKLSKCQRLVEKF